MNPATQVQAWIASHHSVLLAGGGVAGAAYVMRKRAQSKAAAAPAPGVSAAGVVPPAFADTSAYDAYNSLNDELSAWEQGIQSQIDGLSSGGNAAPTPTPTPPAPTPAPAPAPTPAPIAHPLPAPRPITTQPIWQFREPLSQTQLNSLTTAQRNALAAGPYVTIQPGDPRAAAGVYSASGILLGPLGSTPTGKY